MSDLQANAKLAQSRKHQASKVDVPGSILSEGNILLLKCFFTISSALKPRIDRFPHQKCLE